jgi:hypothetical protein
VFNKEVIDPFIERQSDKLARWLNRRAVRVAAGRRAHHATYSSVDEAEIARRVAAEIERRMQHVPAATRRRTAAQEAQTTEGESSTSAATADTSLASVPA